MDIIKGIFGGDDEKHSHTHGDEECNDLHAELKDNRFHSFAPQTSGHVKWHVDGCAYFWALSEALEEAQETIYIMDWWLSPELYLRRPPAKNNKYRLDNMLQAAAERGVKVHVIVYKEVEQALTINSKHSKEHLEALHENIKVFRHPDHVPSGEDFSAEFKTAFSNLTNAFSMSKLSGDAVKSLYGTSDDVVLYWSHHEKLCIVDNKITFMGGLDACYGRWDTNTHPIADAHPGNIDGIIYPGQDFNNARIYDFSDVDKWEQNKLDRAKNARMGWSDISISMTGPIVNSQIRHFTDRWNFIWGQKYNTDERAVKYQMIEADVQHAPAAEGLVRQSGGRSYFSKTFGSMFGSGEGQGGEEAGEEQQEDHGAHIQMCRSCTSWSSGMPTEHSIANAYIEAIGNAQKFVYIENQFFITATDDEQHPVYNKIGGAIVARILRAHEFSEPFRVIVAIPAVPAFAGDLKSDGALGTRAIMEFQYNSINRGGHSIIEKLQEGGIEDPSQYISFYNLRNYDRLNVSSTMRNAEEESGVRYDDARREFDDTVEAGYDGYSRDEETQGRLGSQYHRYQAAAANQADQTWDTVSAAYMSEGPDLNAIPWEGDEQAEMDAYVSEELYIHTKVLIADDRLVICGSANLNDRSQLGTHDSEIAVVIEDPTPVEMEMGGQAFTGSKFATSLRRFLFRKHLGLLPNQRWDQPDDNFRPVNRAPNDYDWDSAADRLVADPMSSEFDELWRGTARTNTEVFSKAFHNVPNDVVRSWDDYDNFFSKYFIVPGSDEAEELKEKKEKGEDEDESDDEDKERPEGPEKVPYGHVVREEFPGGVQELKEWLGRVRGTLVEMPLGFLGDVKDIAKSGLSLNSFTDDIYT
ncbi:unnamed protein product [Discula destructiva]